MSHEENAVDINAWKLIEPYWDSVSIYDGAETYLRCIETVPLAIQHLLAVHWCNSEVCNGGIHQFFHNSTGVLAPEAIRGFAAIGLEELAALLKQALTRFSSPYPRDRETRRRELESLKRPGTRREEWDPFYSLDDKYYAAIDRLELDARMDDFARLNSH